jgi:hypothetical protein
MGYTVPAYGVWPPFMGEEISVHEKAPIYGVSGLRFLGEIDSDFVESPHLWGG